MLYNPQSFSLVSSCDPHNNPKVDVIISILLTRKLKKKRFASHGAILSASSLEPHQDPVPFLGKRATPAPLVVWKKGSLAPRNLTNSKAGVGVGCGGSVGDYWGQKKTRIYYWVPSF